MDLKKKKVLSVEEMFAAKDEAFAEVSAWGGLVRIGSLDAGTMIDFVEQNKGPGQRTANIRLIIQSLVDENGVRIGKMEMLEQFKKKSAATIRALSNEILKLNGLTPSGVDISAQLKDAGKDPDKLKALVDELRQLADAVEAAGTDEKELAKVLESPRASAKNG